MCVTARSNIVLSMFFESYVTHSNTDDVLLCTDCKISKKKNTHSSTFALLIFGRLDGYMFEQKWVGVYFPKRLFFSKVVRNEGRVGTGRTAMSTRTFVPPGQVHCHRGGRKMGDAEGSVRADPRVEYISARVQATFPKMAVRVSMHLSLYTRSPRRSSFVEIIAEYLRVFSSGGEICFRRDRRGGLAFAVLQAQMNNMSVSVRLYVKSTAARVHNNSGEQLGSQ